MKLKKQHKKVRLRIECSGGLPLMDLNAFAAAAAELLTRDMTDNEVKILYYFLQALEADVRTISQMRAIQN